ncbi:MAG: hypothetical protein B7Z05_04120 [Thiotrichales bacterium 32-46-8]|nr:carbonic anhydrase family protein [Gammaproteobacteria bacterium]OYX06683.1 MAG: hypothetical protein B7Z05_04120 [Thiotrichales bacterium 32-46-8]OYY23426.1 MAG: hypothetical protein B7Y68_06130 [Thiotrichales bacterium 35-46-9]OZA75131.1 MAG: hypothetical protein B7X74_00960 [Thiotrichales bacterium 39-47-5]OZA96764.1 MAG: hypothetical protein B7X52_04475 [Thiotrichales bacterium 34-46-19]HQR81698.1 carbonic anhydrase family protein [Thiotrichales bacterium]
MKKTVALVALLASNAVLAGHGVHWAYSGNEGPEYWGKLAQEYSTCSTGKNQSPVNLTQEIKAELSPLTFNYQTTATEVENNGHTVQVNFPAGSTLSLDGHVYTLKQFHFHTTSENTIDGKSFPLEGHLVHADDKGNLAVVAVMFDQGAANEALNPIWKAMPAKANQKSTLPQAISASGLLPADASYFRFNGSLTTPPCTEGVMWLVLKTPVTVSEEQVAQFEKAVGGHNNRPLQPLNARAILK